MFVNEDGVVDVYFDLVVFVVVVIAVFVVVAQGIGEFFFWMSLVFFIFVFMEFGSPQSEHVGSCGVRATNHDKPHKKQKRALYPVS